MLLGEAHILLMSHISLDAQYYGGLQASSFKASSWSARKWIPKKKEEKKNI
jgi:hypothetical protein